MKTKEPLIPCFVVDMHATLSAASTALRQAYSIKLEGKGIPGAYYTDNEKALASLKASLAFFEQDAEAYAGAAGLAYLKATSRERGLPMQAPPVLFEIQDDNNLRGCVLADRTATAAVLVIRAKEAIEETWGEGDMHFQNCRQFLDQICPHLIALHDAGAIDMQPVFGPDTRKAKP